MRLTPKQIAWELKKLEESHAQRRPYTDHPYIIPFADRLALERLAVSLGVVTAQWAINTQTKKLQKKIAAVAKGDDALKKLEDSEDALLEKQEHALEFDKHPFSKPNAKAVEDAMKDVGIDRVMATAMQVRTHTPRKHRAALWAQDKRKVVEWLLTIFPTVKKEDWDMYEREGKIVVEVTDNQQRPPAQAQRYFGRAFEALRHMGEWLEVIELYFRRGLDAKSTAEYISHARVGGVWEKDGQAMPAEPITQEQVERIVKSIENKRKGVRL
jgi:hypothetical protein